MLDSTSHAQLSQEIQSLRETVTALQLAMETRHRVTLRTVQDRPFLGQPVTIIATVTDGSGTKSGANVPVTFTATWGKLRTTDGHTIQKGSTITAHTSVNGTVRVTLLPPTSEELWERQQAALETMLRLLDSNADTPREAETDLQEMAREYRREVNIQLRQAVDIYFRDFGQQLLDTVNKRDYMLAWSYFDSVVIAYAQDNIGEDTVRTSVQSTAALPLRFKNWLGPWLQTYLELSKNENKLGNRFQNIKQLSKEADVLADGVYDLVRDSVIELDGLAAEYVGQKVVEKSIRDFLD